MFFVKCFSIWYFYHHLLKDKVKEYEEKNPNVNVRERPTIFKFIVLQTLLIAKTIYGIYDIKINKEYIQELNRLIVKDFNGIFDKDEHKNDT